SIVHKYWLPAKINKIKSEEFWDNLSREFKCNREELRTNLMAHFKINHDILNLIKKLKKKYKIVMLSNQIEDWLEEVIDKNKLKDIFDIIITSYDTKLAKPDIEIFKETIRIINTNPEECVFVDDQEANIKSAETLGIKGILFINQSDLEKKLEEIL
ncbi:MAG: HAD-IA family hydrolase, partial [Nanoarchaeota archaeon]|nr:HAD-IA family hydrolase [Nanoarchaeota archaeon]